MRVRWSHIKTPARLIIEGGYITKADDESDIADCGSDTRYSSELKTHPAVSGGTYPTAVFTFKPGSPTKHELPKATSVRPPAPRVTTGLPVIEATWQSTQFGFAVRGHSLQRALG